MAKLEKATITVLSGNNANKVIEVLFNPAEYSFDRGNAWKASVVPGLGGPLYQFSNGEAASLSMDLFFDDYTDPAARQTGASKKSVKDRLDEMNRLLDIDAQLHAPSPVRFAWGAFQFTGIIEKIARKVLLFQPDGTPARARLTLSLKEYRSLNEQLQQPRRESTDKSKRRQIVGNDRLWALAQREYTDPKHWRTIAEFNDMDDPLDLTPGRWLLLPPLEKNDGS